MSWLPAIADRPGPKYLRIADALAEDIYSGRLAAGDRLPTHRELAWRLSVTVGTVSRAYSEAERRGLIVGEVGRGSFVRPGARSSQTLDMPGIAAPRLIELGVNRPPAHLGKAEMSAALVRLAGDPRLSDLMNYQAHTGAWDHREAGAAWVARRGVSHPASNVLLTSGAEHAIASALMGLTDPGDTILVEGLTWSGVRALASLHRLSLKPVAMDAEGLIPEAFEAACRVSGARLLYCMPTIHNPTTAYMPAERREAIAGIARKYGVTIIEDDVYGFLPDDPTPALSAYAPERCIYITAASKCVAPGMRVGFAALPSDRIGRFSAASRALNWMAPPAMAEIVSGWIRDGTADELASRIRADVKRRQAIATRLLDGLSYQTHPAAFHVWLELPEPWRGGDVVRMARNRGLSMTATEMFVPGRGEPPHALRVTVSATRDDAELEAGLSVLRDIIESRPEPCLAVA
ncbi:PLP-dependent aminotransferase family protein [Fodinicurvata sp. EGI_FJ10296]|uniref:aminotransferase-like domain-containing protein n=1 Tax=Fodinicurvata sp. EGI_FJ10296 TaxID=3231908 RepID=UPI0034521999